VLAASIIRVASIIALMMAAANTSETSVNFYQTTWHNNSEDSHLHTRHRENLKCHNIEIDETPHVNIPTSILKFF
jgi:hypothetical protein